MALDVFMIEKRLFGDFTPFASWMFHGRARRYGAAYPLLEYRLGDKLEHPLFVTKNIYAMGRVFQPNLNWILAEEVFAQLHEIRSLDFLAVSFEKTFWVPYNLGDDPFPDAEDEEEVLDYFDHDPTLFKQLGTWYEMIVPRLGQAVPESGSAQELLVPRELSSEPLRLTLSESFVEEIPIFWCEEIFVRGDVFHMIEKSLDRRFFAASRLAIGSPRSG